MRTLLHICCAPCAVAIVDKLRSRPEIELEGFFYNPNIHPIEEHNLRKKSVELMAANFNLPLTLVDEDGLNLWKNNLGPDQSVRCTACYAMRLDAAAKLASENNFDSFTTSLLISPYQNHELIKNLGETIAKKYGISFYYEDFRDLYRKGREISRGKGFYMQKYCGCFYSYSESDHPKKPIYNL